MLPRPVTKLPSVGVAPVVGATPFVLGVTDCLPTTTFPAVTEVVALTVPSFPLMVTTLSPVAPLLKVVSPLALNSTLPLPAALVILLMLPRSLFNFTVNVELPSASTEILPLADVNVLATSLVTPSPTIFTNVFSFCLFSVSELLPVKRNPSSIVAT